MIKYLSIKETSPAWSWTPSSMLVRILLCFSTSFKAVELLNCPLLPSTVKIQKVLVHEVVCSCCSDIPSTEIYRMYR